MGGVYPKAMWAPHPVPPFGGNLWDPLGFMDKLSDEQKATKRNAELANGRLAMIGTMSLVASATVKGSVPALTTTPEYVGNPFAPFASDSASSRRQARESRETAPPHGAPMTVVDWYTTSRRCGVQIGSRLAC